MKQIIKIIVYILNSVSALSLIPFILLSSDYDPVWLQGIPYRELGGLGLFFLPISALWAVYFIIAGAVERRWKLSAYSLAGLLFIFIATSASIQMIGKITIRESDRIALQILVKNDMDYKFDVHDNAMNDLRAFQKDFDVSAINRMSAVTPYGRYDYIITPKSSSPFIMTIFRNRKDIMISKAGIEHFLKRKDTFVKVAK
jgi:hypothetical protein